MVRPVNQRPGRRRVRPQTATMRPRRSHLRALSDHAVERRASALADRNYESFVKWIPIVVPLFAVLIVVQTYLIGSAVL